MSDTKTTDKPAFRDAADLVASQADADVLFINSPIYRPLDTQVRELVGSRRRRPNVVLILVTSGGNADAGYRIARCLQASYKRVTLFVTGFCKSTGTLIALGAHQLVMTDHGELGPLDVQMSKPDELIQRQSGLTATAALSTLHQQAFQAFEHFFLSLVGRSGSSISTRTATQLAVQFASNLFGPMYGHVDPMHVGEAGRALLIAEQYGQLLAAESRNLKPDALAQLTTGFASHGFVIDRKQVEGLFVRVRAANTNELSLARSLAQAALQPKEQSERPMMAYLSGELPEEQALPLGAGEHESALQRGDQQRPGGTDHRPSGATPAGQPGAAAEAHIPSSDTVGAGR